MNGYLDAMRRYGRFRGRASRAEYWQFILIATVILVVALFIDGSRGSGLNRSEPFFTVAVLVHLLPSWAVSVRRLHDTGRSGWLLLITIIPLIGTLLLIIWACEASTPNVNQYGLEPQGGDDRQSDQRPALPPQPAAGDMIAEIERLARLKASGSLSEVEFEVLKSKALGRG